MAGGVSWGRGLGGLRGRNEGKEGKEGVWYNRNIALRVRGPDLSYPIVDRREITGTAEQLIERGRQFVADHMRTAYEFPEDSARRREIPEYPLDAVREALANAVAHRDYRPNERIQLRLYDDRLEVQNPGGLLPGLTLEQVLSLPTPRRRNHLICMRWKASMRACEPACRRLRPVGVWSECPAAGDGESRDNRRRFS